MTHNGRATVVRGSCDGGTTVAALATERRVSKDTIRRAIKLGELSAHRVDGRNGPAWCVHPGGELRPSHDGVQTVVRGSYDGMQTVVRGSGDGQETTSPGVGVSDEAVHLAALVRDLTAQLAGSHATAAMWQERARVLADRLALAPPDASHGPGAGQEAAPPPGVDPVASPASTGALHGRIAVPIPVAMVGLVLAIAAVVALLLVGPAL